jgi:hypothetical protein
VFGKAVVGRGVILSKGNSDRIGRISTAPTRDDWLPVTEILAPHPLTMQNDAEHG